MALTPLATTADLTARGIETSETGKVDAFLQSASDEIRHAAGVPITQETVTIEIPGVCDQWLHLPGQPVTSVSSVEIDGEAVTDYKLVGGHLWRRKGWQDASTDSAFFGVVWAWEPVNVTVALTGGLTEVPTDIVDLVCAMVGHALAESDDGGYASRGDLTSARIDDYSEQYAGTATTKLAGPMELPEATRQRLRARFGGNAGLVRSR